jgi:hypothetical protein
VGDVKLPACMHCGGPCGGDIAFTCPHGGMCEPFAQDRNPARQLREEARESAQCELMKSQEHLERMLESHVSVSGAATELVVAWASSVEAGNVKFYGPDALKLAALMQALAGEVLTLGAIANAVVVTPESGWC